MYLKKTTEEILRQTLTKLADTTPITSLTPGSVARSMVELVAADLGDFFEIFDFNMGQSILSTATGRSLDLWGHLYSVKRKEIGDLAAASAKSGSFYFYVETPLAGDLLIPRGTVVSTDRDGSVANIYTHRTTEDVVLRAGRLRVYAALSFSSLEFTFTTGKDTLVNHSFVPPNNIKLRCTNPKSIEALYGRENDDDYRARIIAETRRQAGGTELAIRFTVLSVDGVRDVVIRSAAYGLGTAEIVVITEKRENATEIIAKISKKLDHVRPVGVKLFVKSPKFLGADINMMVSTNAETGTVKQSILAQVRVAIMRYLNGLTIGEEMVYNRMTSEILSSVEQVSDVTYNKLSINGSEVLRRNYKPNADEHIVPGHITVQ